MKDNTVALGGVAVILGIELRIFSGSFSKFFNHDSLFYLIYYPHSWGEWLRIFARPDPTQQYRPMTLAVMGLIGPVLGLDPKVLHWIPLLFHLVNTCLFYLLARRLMRGTVGPLCATALWGLHSAAAWVTYDVGYFPDFLMAFFALSFLIVAVDGHRLRSRARLGFSLFLFVAALLSKEAMVALPLGLLVCLVLSDLKDVENAPGFAAVRRSAIKAAPFVGICLAITLLHAGRLVWWLASGALYAQGTAQAYDINPLGNVFGKARYLYWVLNLPDAASLAGRRGKTAFLLMALLLAAWLFDLLRRRVRLSLLELGGLLWLAGMLLPALMLSGRTAKWYVYVPGIGAAWVLGSLASRMQAWIPRLPLKFMAPGVFTFFLIPTAFSSSVQTREFLASGNPSFVSGIFERLVQAFGSSPVPHGGQVTLFFLPSYEADVLRVIRVNPSARLLQLFYPGTRFRIMYADKGDTLPSDYEKRPDIKVLQCLQGHICDVTGYYKGRRRDPCAVRVIPELANVSASVSRDEFYPRYDRFDTPSGKPLFYPTPGDDIVTQIGGSTAVLPPLAIPADARLRFDVSWMNDTGDGAWAEVSALCDGRRESLFRKYMNPNQKGSGLAWEEVGLDLAAYAGRQVQFVLSCRNDPGRTTVADWLNWRDMRLESRMIRLPSCP